MSQIAVLDKAASILGLLGANSLSAAEIAARLEMSRSTCYRLISSLEEHRFVVRDSRGCFALGPFPGNRPTHDVAATLRGIRDETGESAQLWMRAGSVRACVLAIESRNELRISKSAGSALPLAEGGSAALALMGSADSRELYVTQEARRTGVGSASIAFRVSATDGASDELFAVCVSFPTIRAPEDFEEAFADSLRAAADSLALSLPGSESLDILKDVATASHQ